MTSASPHTLVHMHTQLHTFTCVHSPDIPDVCDFHRCGHQSFAKWWLTSLVGPQSSSTSWPSIGPCLSFPICNETSRLPAGPALGPSVGCARHFITCVRSRRTCPLGDRLDFTLFLCRQVTVLGPIYLEFRVPRAHRVPPGLSPPSRVRLSTTRSWQASSCATYRVSLSPLK